MTHKLFQIDGPVWPNGCSHDGYVVSFESVSGRNNAEQIDLYVFENVHQQHICLRYGAEPSEYYSPGDITTMAEAAHLMPVYDLALCFLRSMGSITWTPARDNMKTPPTVLLRKIAGKLAGCNLDDDIQYRERKIADLLIENGFLVLDEHRNLLDESHHDFEKHVPFEKPELTNAAINFFEVEIRNEQEGGTSPATLGSALHSLMLAPSDVIIEWCNDDAVRDEDLVDNFVEYIGELAEKYGKDHQLELLLPGPEDDTR